MPNTCTLAAALKPDMDKSSKVRGLTITTTRKNITGGSTAAQQISPSTVPAHQPEGRKQLILSRAAQRKQRVPNDLPSVSSVSPDAIPGLRRQASVVDPEQAKQQEKGWGLAFKDPSKAVPVRKEVGYSCAVAASKCVSNVWLVDQQSQTLVLKPQTCLLLCVICRLSCMISRICLARIAVCRLWSCILFCSSSHYLKLAANSRRCPHISAV